MKTLVLILLFSVIGLLAGGWFVDAHGSAHPTFFVALMVVSGLTAMLTGTVLLAAWLDSKDNPNA